MDAVVFGALEEICSQGANGLTLPNLWPKLQSHLSSNGLHLCNNVKKALWSNLLNIPSLRFQSLGVSYDAEDPKIQSFEDSEAMDLKIVAAEHLLNSFVGIYDIKASDAGISQQQRRALERLAIARTNGITQNELAKEFGIKGNNIYYILRNLESRGLIVRQSTIIRKKEAGNDGEHKNSSIVNTNMLHLYRYAKHLGRLQRLEITKEDKAFADNENMDRDTATCDSVFEDRIKEDVHVKDFVPALRAICDRLEKADGKVLVVSDIKRELGYRKTSGHRAWRNILHRLKDARVVEDFCAKVNNKEVSCLRLLKKFSPKTFDPKTHGGRDDDLDTEQQVKLGKRGQITDQLLELPIEQQIYDMIAAEGSKGLIITEVYKRLGISNKRYYPRILDMVSRFRMHLDSEALNRGVVYRVWTSGNFNPEVLDTLPGNLEDTMDENYSAHAHMAETTQEVDHLTSKEDVEVNGEKEATPIESGTAHASPTFDCDEQNTACEPSAVIPDEELQIVSVKPVSGVVSLQMSPSASPTPRRRRSYQTYPCLSLSSASLQREQRILEKLQEEQVLIKPELHRLLESLEKEKHTAMDRRTLERSLNKLQEEGHCKIISFTVPVVTNCRRKRIIEVIVHPSVYNAEDLSDRVHERLRSFEKQIRTQGFPRQEGRLVPVLNDVERIQTSARKDDQTETCEAMRNNGFVLAKMVRAKLLHIFLWGYITRVPGWDDAISLGKHGYEQKNPHSTCRLFELDAAIKAMPVELFLQVVGSSVKFEDMIEKCRNGLCLSDLPVLEYRCLMETRATARLSYLIDILRRLKLIRLVGGEVLDSTEGPHATLRHSLQLKPYIEEPVALVLPSTDVDHVDLRPHVRHDFVLASRKGVDKYWNTLEYSYAACDPKAALHAFPGSAVHEVFLSRSWTSVRVMTAEQRVELFKRVADDDSDKKLSFKMCEQIAEELNLSLEQVLRVFYDKRRKRRLKGAASVQTEELQPLTRALVTRKRKRSSKGKPSNKEKTLMDDEESGKLEQSKISETKDAAEEQYSFIRSLKDHKTHMVINEIGHHEEAINDLDLRVDEEDHASLDECALSKLHPARRKRFAWTENTDRLLLIEYVRHRAVLGAKFHRIGWATIQHLPAPPNACLRRMAKLNKNDQFRKAVMGLCNMLSARYAKHLENSSNKLLGDNCAMIIRDQSCNKDINGNDSGSIDHDKDLNFEERWDDFDKEDLKMALDEVLRYKQTTKLETTKGAGFITKYPRSNIGVDGQEFHDTRLVSSATSGEQLKGSGWKQATSGRSRYRLPKNYIRLMNGGKGSGTQAYKSLAVANAVELFKLVFLSTAKAPEVPNLLAETLRRYSEHDLFAAFNYLRDSNFMVGGHGSQFSLSQQFLHNISSSPFPVNTGKRAVRMARWVHVRDKDLLKEGTFLSADLQCGDVFHLCALVSSGEVSISPCLPDEGVGEIEELKKRKCDDNEMCSVDKAKKPKLLDSEIFFRKEKGFPGIRLSLNHNMISRVDAITLFRDENSRSTLSLRSKRGSSSGLNLGQHASPPRHIKETFDSGHAFSMMNATSESQWESMSCYAAHLASCVQEQSPFYPNLFRTVYSAIQKAGDQGLSMEEISQIMDVNGEEMAKIIVEVLEAFGQALKVNAYDSIHVVDSLYRVKYRLTRIESHHQDLEVPKSGTSDGAPLMFQPEIDDGEGTNLPNETFTDTERGSNTDEMHSVTILNHPEEVPQPMSAQRDNEIETYKKAKVTSPRKGPEEKSKYHVSPSYKPLLPWVNGDGTINEIVFKGLVRRVLGIVMQNPGILEEDVLSQMYVLNPQSCRKLLELMVLDNHITVRKMYESTSSDPPAILGSLLGCSSKKPKLVCRDHFFANPMSVSCL